MKKPKVTPTKETREFWNGCQKDILKYQYCNTCNTSQLIPGSVCKHCQSNDLKWAQSKGKGTILSFTEVHRAPISAFREETPYFIALIDMDEGFRLMTNINRDTHTQPFIGQPVTIVFTQQGEQKIPLAQLE